LESLHKAAEEREGRIALDDSPEWLREWRNARRIAVWDGKGHNAGTLLEAIRENRTVVVRYYGGSKPGHTRRICPSSLFLVEGYPGLYVTAYYLQNKATRTFCCDQLEVLA
jgi:predicted DNA-binding transcriptional regulator YafY